MTRKSIFHEEWWLEALAPGRWREVTCVRGGRMAGYLRFVERHEGRMAICEMPQITRLLGPVVMPQAGKTVARTRATHSIITDLLEQIAGHDHVEMVLDTGFTDLAPFLAAGCEVKVHPTLLLDCRRPSDELWAGLRDKTRNVVRRAKEKLVVQEIADANSFIQLYEASLEGEECYFDLSILSTLIAAVQARGQCRIVAAVDGTGTAHAQVLYIWDDKYVHYFLSSRNKAVAHVGAVSLLVWTGIELAHSLGLSFDFDGGIIKDEKYQFLVSFGGELANRFEVARSTPRYRVQHTLRRVPRAVARRLSLAAQSVDVRSWAGQKRIGSLMPVKSSLMPLARGIGRVPGVSQVLRLPAVRRMLAVLPGIGSLLSANAEPVSWNRVHPFDVAHGTDTSGFVSVAELEQPEREVESAHSLPYSGSQPSIVRAALAALQPLDSFAFLDLGCGKGRPLLVASELPFREIIGVELSPSLARIAQRNAELIGQRFPQRTPIRVVTGDAGRFPLPDGNLVMFLYNPFGDAVVAGVAEAVNAALLEARRTIYVVYYNPVVGHRFDAAPRLRRHFAGTLPYAADELGYGPDSEDPVIVWQGGVELSAKDKRADARIQIIDPKFRVKLVSA